MRNVQLQPKYSFKFLTLTIPNMDNPVDQLKQLRSSFRRLRQRKWWKDRVKGGCIFYEVKTAKDGKYHIHLHAIVESKYLPQKDLAELWQAVSPGSIVDIRWISDKAIVNYITKYTTKSDLSLKDQLAATKLLKNSRLFQPFGSWHSIALKYVHDPYRCPHCNIADWHYKPDHMTEFELMWSKARSPVKVPVRIVKDFQYELGLRIRDQIQQPCLTGVDYDPTFSFNSK